MIANPVIANQVFALSVSKGAVHTHLFSGCNEADIELCFDNIIDKTEACIVFYQNGNTLVSGSLRYIGLLRLWREDIPI